LIPLPYYKRITPPEAALYYGVTALLRVGGKRLRVG
jgi:hypothetical protein